MPKVSLTAASLEVQDDKKTWCKSCKVPAEEGSEHCHPCGLYWKDVENGLWNSDLLEERS